MKNQKDFFYRNSYQKCKKFSSRRYSCLFFILLIWQIVILPPDTYAQLAEGKDKFLGCAIDLIFHSHFADYWNQVTPGNAGKWGSVEGSQDSYNWTQLDAIYNYAMSNDFLYKHHTLIWGSQQPSWITSLDSASQRAEVEEWIQLVGQRYPDMDFVDVVNEPFNAPPSYMEALGGSGKTGWDWVITAFQLARQYCGPDVKLMINEYNVLHSNEITDNYLALIDTLRVRGLIDAIGIQGHYFEFKSAEGQQPSYEYSLTAINNNLDNLAATGLPIYITEFDINEENDNTQLENYQIYFPLFWEHPAVAGITLWGYVENDTWKPNAYIVLSPYRERPALQWLRAYINSPFAPSLIYPVFIYEIEPDPVMQWHASESATSYRLQLSRNRDFGTIIVDTTVVDTMLQMDSLAANTRYYWRVSASNEHGTSTYSSPVNFTTAEDITSIANKAEIPDEFRLFQNYPNPFNPTTAIGYQLSAVSDVELSVYNVVGERVVTLVSQQQRAGYHQVEWDASAFSSGVYYCVLRASDFQQIRKMILVK